MQIIVRAAGERTEAECIRLAGLQGDVHVLRFTPFAEAVKKTYKLIAHFDQEWTPVVDADVLLYDNSLKKGIEELNRQINKEKIFCFDGRTNDKIMISHRRAGVHIYRTEHMLNAILLIDAGHIKPESNVCKKMDKQGLQFYYKSKLIFGRHDFEQYYRDLWRKAVCQTEKIGGMIEKRKMFPRWEAEAIRDPDFRIIVDGHIYGKTLSKLRVDATKDYGWTEYKAQNKIIEKAELCL